MTGTPSSVALHPFDESSITPEYLGWLNDRVLLRYSRQRYRRHTRESSLEYLRSFEGSPSRFWSVRRSADGVQVGTMTAFLDPDEGTGDLGILIGVPGRGYGREAWGLGMRALFQDLGLRRVTGGTVAENSPMVRIFLAWGMRLEGTRREHQLVDGRPVDVLLFGMLAREWSVREDRRG